MKLKHLLFFLGIASSTLVFSQKKNKVVISGIVMDSLNNPVANSVIFLDNYKSNKTTNKKGYFKVKVKDLPKGISAYAGDYGFKTVAYSGDNKVTIKFDGNSLKSARFIALYAAQALLKKKPKQEQFFATIYDYLRVEAPMLRITGDNKIAIRGRDSNFITSNEPLFIVNGAPVSTIAALVPSNIKTFSLLRGSSAASYGVRGAGGVLVFTTK